MKPPSHIVPLSLLASWLVAGCHHTPQLRAKAVSDLNCPDVAVSEPAQFVGHASGCGKEVAYRWDGHNWITPLDRAAFELKCDKQNLTGKILDERTFGVQGCGASVVYVLTPPTGMSRGEWVLNSTSQETGSATTR